MLKSQAMVTSMVKDCQHPLIYDALSDPKYASKLLPDCKEGSRAKHDVAASPQLARLSLKERSDSIWVLCRTCEKFHHLDAVPIRAMVRLIRSSLRVTASPCPFTDAMLTIPGVFLWHWTDLHLLMRKYRLDRADRSTLWQHETPQVKLRQVGRDSWVVTSYHTVDPESLLINITCSTGITWKPRIKDDIWMSGCPHSQANSKLLKAEAMKLYSRWISATVDGPNHTSWKSCTRSAMFRCCFCPSEMQVAITTEGLNHGTLTISTWMDLGPCVTTEERQWQRLTSKVAQAASCETPGCDLQGGKSIAIRCGMKVPGHILPLNASCLTAEKA